MLNSIIVALVALALLYATSPFMIWRSYFHVFRSVLTSDQVDFKGRMSMLAHLLRELLYVPFYTILWWLDEIIFGIYRKANVTAPVFVMSQPRSGTTFLLRTLASDEQTFFVLKHLDWRMPFISFWRLIDALGLRKKLESIDYWPSTEIGRLASKMHFHNLGSVEGHGVFFEERMYHHYFTFRRFPLPEVLARVDGVTHLNEGERRKIVRTLRKAVQKAAYYRGENRFWVTKENENIDMFRLVHEAFPDARFLVIVRKPTDFVRSYVRMSDSCTTPKHGVDPNGISGWYEANMAFRQRQCDKHIEFCRDLETKNAITYVTFDEFTHDVQGSMQTIYKSMNIPMPDSFSRHLKELQRKQNSRERGYDNTDCDTSGFETYASFVDDVAGRKNSLSEADLQSNLVANH